MRMKRKMTMSKDRIFNKENPLEILSNEELSLRGRIRESSLVLEANQIDINGDNIAELCKLIRKLNQSWWENPETGEPIDRNFGEIIALCHSELSEALEGHRKNLADDKLPWRSAVEVELADCIIRIFDLAGGLGMDLEGAMWEKLAFNKQRADHKPEERLKEGGKKY
jgi:NTP pyrophosphatase (non-canonical NTP hydrolase)